MFIRACIKVAPLYPNTKILNCSLNSPHASIRTYGIRIYAGKYELPTVLSGLGIAILSTNQCVITDKEARKLQVGCEVLAFVW